MAGRVREPEEVIMKISPPWTCLCLLFAASVLGWHKTDFKLIDVASL